LAHLRYALSRDTPYRAWRSFQGIEHVVGIDEGWRSLFGGHHEERGSKKQWDALNIRGRWEIERERWIPEFQVPVPPWTNHLHEHSFGANLLRKERSARRDLITAWAHAATFGVPGNTVSEAVDLLYPGIAGHRGFAEELRLSRALLSTTLVNERGPRPLEMTALQEWHRGPEVTRYRIPVLTLSDQRPE
jgi:hypothetical protein